jgi:hypothetical protein
LLHIEHARQIKAHLLRHDDIAAAKLFAVYSQDASASDAAAAAGITLSPLAGVLPAALAPMIRSLDASGPALFRAAKALGAVGPRCSFDGAEHGAEVALPHGFSAHTGHNLSLVTKFADAVWVGAVTARP